MDLKRIKRLMTIMEKENLAELELEDEEFKVKITKPQIGEIAPLVVQSKPITSPKGATKIPIKEFEKEKLVKMTSPMVGFFYHSQTPTSPPYVEVGDKIMPSQIVGAIEVMGVINEIEAKVSGEVKKILVEDGHPVEYGQPLFLIEPKEERNV